MKWGLNRISFIRTYAHKDLHTRTATMEAGSVVEGEFDLWLHRYVFVRALDLYRINRWGEAVGEMIRA